MNDQTAPSSLRLVPGWILGSLALVVIAVSIYVLDLFLGAYKYAIIVQRIDQHLAAHSSAMDISNDPILNTVINEKNEESWKLLRRLAFFESGNNQGLNPENKVKKKHGDAASSRIDKLIAKHDSLHSTAEGLVVSIQTELTPENLATYSRIAHLLEKGSLLIILRRKQFITSMKIATYATTLKDTTRRELLTKARPAISNSEEFTYNSLRPLLEPLLGSLPEIKENNSLGN